MNFMKKCLKTKANINSGLSKFSQRPATTTISHPKKNKHYTETPLFKNVSIATLSFLIYFQEFLFIAFFSKIYFRSAIKFKVIAK